MRFPLVAAAIAALLLVGCGDPTKSTTDIGPESTPAETPEATEPSPTAAPPTQSPGNTLVETPEYTGVIITEDGASDFGILFDESITAFWEPSIDDVSRAEERIRQFLVSAHNDPNLDAYQRANLAFILDNLEDYLRQYVGIVVDGEKRIGCNFFLSDRSFPDWERRPVFVLDGGHYFWQIEYDLLGDECINFYVHGEA